MHAETQPLIMYFQDQRMLAEFKKAYHKQTHQPFLREEDWDLIDWKSVEEELSHQIWLTNPSVGENFYLIIPPDKTISGKEESLLVGKVGETPRPEKQAAKDPKNWQGEHYKGNQWVGYYRLNRQLQTD